MRLGQSYQFIQHIGRLGECFIYAIQFDYFIHRKYKLQLSDKAFGKFRAITHWFLTASKQDPLIS